MNVEKLIEFEGLVPHLYLDSVGIVTVGIGHACFHASEATALPGWDKPEAVADDYRRVVQSRGLTNRASYSALCKARLADDSIRSIAVLDAAKNTLALRRILPEYSEYPEAARDALDDMAFNLGGAFPLSWPLFREAVLTRNWIGAANQCARKYVGDARNQWTKEQFLACSEQDKHNKENQPNEPNLRDPYQ